MDETLRDQINALANERGEINGTANLRPLLEEAEAEGLLEVISGRLSMQPPITFGRSIELLGHSIPLIGTLCSVYRLTDKARATNEEETLSM